MAEDSLASETADLPEGLLDVIKGEQITCCKFNIYKTILAAGTIDGKIHLFDWCYLKGPVRSIVGHSCKVAALSWNKEQKNLATCSSSGALAIWEIPTFASLVKCQLEKPVGQVNSLEFSQSTLQTLLCCTSEAVYLISCSMEQPNSCQQTIILQQEGGDFHGGFLKDGISFVIGDSSGTISLFQNGQKTASLKVSTSAISMLVIHPHLNQCIFDASDTVIAHCVINTDDELPAEGKIHQTSLKFSDKVNKTKWTSFIFSGSGLFVLASGSHRNGKSEIFSWDSSEGRFFRCWEEVGSQEQIRMLESCPSSSDFVAVSSFGHLYFYSSKRAENWAAYAPNFTPIEENIEYVEREDEFDIDPVSGVPKYYSIQKDDAGHSERESMIEAFSDAQTVAHFGQEHVYLRLDTLEENQIPDFSA